MESRDEVPAVQLPRERFTGRDTGAAEIGVAAGHLDIAQCDVEDGGVLGTRHDELGREPVQPRRSVERGDGSRRTRTGDERPEHLCFGHDRARVGQMQRGFDGSLVPDPLQPRAAAACNRTQRLSSRSS